MKHIYIITEQGRVWNRAGMDWIETVLKPSLGETDQTTAYMGALYNDRQVLLDELAEHPDSYVLLSYEHIDTICGPEVQELCRRLRASLETQPDATSWQVFMQYSIDEQAVVA